MNDLLDRFTRDYGHLLEEKTLKATLAVLQSLQKRALVPYVPRTRFTDIALQRKRTKTPPGFKDDKENFGDFFIWVDFLYGLLRAKQTNKTFTHAVMVTNDQKPDWSRKGVAHPVLTAEVDALVRCTFEVWSLDELHKAITA